MKLSIIIPVYNAAPYIERCLDSVLNQDINDYEVIAINDGSKDNSLEVMERYKEASPVGHRLKILTQENRGVSAARNRGIDLAQGEYITFVDADDYIADNTLKMIFERIQSKSNGQLPDLINLGTRTISRSNISSESIYDETGAIPSPPIFSPIDINVYGPPWGRLFKREIIILNNIRFIPDIVIGEDRIFNLQFLSHCRIHMFLPIIFYNYILNPNNATIRFHGENLITSYKRCREEIEKYFRGRNEYDSKISNDINRQFAFDYLFGIYSIYRNRGIKHRKKWLRRYWGAASEYDNRWSYQLDSGIPKITAMLGRRSLSLAHCWLRTIFTIERLKNKIKNIK